MRSGDTKRSYGGARPNYLRPAIMGGADGLTLALGLIVSLTGHPGALVRAAIGAGVAEFVGMSAGNYLSDSDAGYVAALANGGAALLACLVPALPYVVSHGAPALVASLVLVVIVAGAISWLRPEKGLLAVVETYGILLVAAGLCYAASFI